MTRALKRGTTAAVIVAALIGVAVWVTAKPYQQDRILIELGVKAR